MPESRATLSLLCLLAVCLGNSDVVLTDKQFDKFLAVEQTIRLLPHIIRSRTFDFVVPGQIGAIADFPKGSRLPVI